MGIHPQLANVDLAAVYADLAVGPDVILNNPSLQVQEVTISAVRVFCMAIGRIPVHIFCFQLIAQIESG